jgi:hypothetical protein
MIFITFLTMSLVALSLKISFMFFKLIRRLEKRVKMLEAEVYVLNIVCKGLVFADSKDDREREVIQ